MKKFYPLWFIIFISFFFYSSMLTMFVSLICDPISPLFIESYSSSTRNILSGVFLSLYPFGQFVGSPIIGAMSDSFGRKKVLINSLFVTFVCLLLISYAIYIKSFILLGVGCFVAGLGESNMAIALSAIADFTTDVNRSQAFAKAWVMCSIGYITGSLFGGVANFVGYDTTFLLQTILVIIGIVLIKFVFYDTIQNKPNTTSVKKYLSNFSNIFTDKALKHYYLLNFLIYFTCFGILRVELIYLQSFFHLNQLSIAFYYSLASVIAMFANFILTPFLLKKMSIQTLILRVGCLAMLSGILFIVNPFISLLFLTVSFIGCFIPILVAMIGANLSLVTSAKNQGSVMGNNQSLQVMAEAISALLGGIIFSIQPQLPFVIFVIIGLVALLFFKMFLIKPR